LIHAATIVTAGVFLIIRCSYIFEYTPLTLELRTIIGASTAFMAATSGLLQSDIKKIIAYSTCSQLGYRIFVCGLSEYALSLFHLVNHAFFKALLFLSAGAIIHALADEQDLRRFGGLSQLRPYTYTRVIIGSLALVGFPFLAGFYSKDVILEITRGTSTRTGLFAEWLGTLTVFFTAFYSFRLLSRAFYSAPRGFRRSYYARRELSPYRAYTLARLAIGSIFCGYFRRDLFVGFSTSFWGDTIYNASPVQTQRVGEFLPV